MVLLGVSFQSISPSSITYVQIEIVKPVINIYISNLQQICHRDLKLENTLLDGRTEPRLKICDFGYSKVNDYVVACPNVT